MKLDINMLKETPQDFEQAVKVHSQLELNGEFNTDENENSIEGCEPVTVEFPFIRKGLKYSIKHAIYTRAYKWYANNINKELTNLKVVGKENLKGIKAGIITCNHISKVDNFAIRAAVGMDIMFVAAEFNNWKGPMGDIARHTGYIPISSTLDRNIMRKTNEAIEYYLKKNKRILIYPEQAMWREYKKPRPMKNGAFHYAIKHKVPIIPLFITIEDKVEKMDEQGRMNFGDYTIHILKPIYPNKDLSNKENIDYLRQENFRQWKEVYEKTYGIPLEYTTLDKSKIKI